MKCKVSVYLHHMNMTGRDQDFDDTSVSTPVQAQLDCDLAASIMSRQTATSVLFVLIVVTIPIIAAFGIIGNFMSACVLVKHGLDKSYNIMLITLAVSDSSFLAALACHGFVCAAGFQYPTSKTSFMFVFYEVLRVLDYGGGWTSMTLPILITAERVIAVFLPLSVSRIITARRTFVAVLCVSMTWYGMMLALTVIESTAMDLSAFSNVSSYKGLIELAAYRNAIDYTATVQKLSTVLFGPIPICLVFAGCLVLAVKIKLTTMKRSRLTGGGVGGSGKGGASTARVTATLLVVCLVYNVTSAVTFLMHSGVVRSYYVEGDRNGMVGIVLGEFVNVVVAINCSVNFIIYVVMNKNFRDTYVAMVRNLCKAK